MRKKPVIVVTTVAIGAAILAWVGILLGAGEPLVVPRTDPRRYVLVAPWPEPQPDTSSPNWKYLSDDVGILIRRDERLGLRARLYVLVDGSWSSVATDDVSNLTATIPAR
jgi:hypothetical protein